MRSYANLKTGYYCYYYLALLTINDIWLHDWKNHKERYFNWYNFQESFRTDMTDKLSVMDRLQTLEREN